MTRRLRRPLTVLAVALTSAVAVAACGGSSSPPSSNAAANTGGSTTPAAGATGAGAASARSAQLAACLKRYGVTLPGGSFAGRRFGATGPGGPFRRFGATGATGATGVPGAGFGAGGGGGGGGFPGGNSKFAAAFAKCGLAGGFRGGGGFGGRLGASGPTGARGFPNPATNSQYQAAIVRYAACMKTYGVTLPTPNFSGVGSVFGSKVDRTTAAFIAANAKCQGILSAAVSGG